ncbi:Ribbon-helix-helix protein CopG domain-containing protein [Candidatus Magnetomoraceae bacterium gMMP-15]
MGRGGHYHVTPESGRLCVNLNKRQIKELKKIAVEFEISEKEVLMLAVDLLIKTYQSLPIDTIDKQGIKALGNSSSILEATSAMI